MLGHWGSFQNRKGQGLICGELPSLWWWWVLPPWGAPQEMDWPEQNSNIEMMSARWVGLWLTSKSPFLGVDWIMAVQVRLSVSISLLGPSP